MVSYDAARHEMGCSCEQTLTFILKWVCFKHALWPGWFHKSGFLECRCGLSVYAMTIRCLLHWHPILNTEVLISNDFSVARSFLVFRASI
jgi:hypothetical protein